MVALVSGERVHAQQGNHRDGVRPWRWRVLKGFAPNVQATKRLGVGGTIEKSAVLVVRVRTEGEVQGMLRSPKITGVERKFVGVKQGQHAKHLIVQRALERGTADAMRKPPGLTPGLLQHAVQGFQREVAAVFSQRAAENTEGLEIRRNEH